VLSWWAEFNFGSAEAAPWPVWATDPPESDEVAASTAKTVGDAISALKGAGVAVDERTMAARFGVPMLAEPTAPASEALDSAKAAKSDCGCGSAHESDTSSDAANESDDPSSELDSPRNAARNSWIGEFENANEAALREALAPSVRSILDAIGRSESFEELRSSLEQLRATMESTQLVAVVERSMELVAAAAYWEDLE
jgi:hypothetical protein